MWQLCIWLLFNYYYWAWGRWSLVQGAHLPVDLCSKQSTLVSFGNLNFHLETWLNRSMCAFSTWLCYLLLQKGAGYHLDLFWVAILMVVCSFMALPWYVAATVISIAHIDSLKMETETSAPGEQPKFLGVRYAKSEKNGSTNHPTYTSMCQSEGDGPMWRRDDWWQVIYFGLAILERTKFSFERESSTISWVHFSSYIYFLWVAKG